MVGPLAVFVDGRTALSDFLVVQNKDNKNS